MSYADELRKLSTQASQTQTPTYRDRANDMIKQYTPAILERCKDAAKMGKNGIKGYLQLTSSGGMPYAQIVDIDPKAFTKKPVPYVDTSPCSYNWIPTCAIRFGVSKNEREFIDNERESADGVLLLQEGFQKSLSAAGFRKLVINAVTAPRYDAYKSCSNHYCDDYKKNPNVNYHLLYVDIQW